MRIGFHVGPFSISESTRSRRRRKMSQEEQVAMWKFFGYIIASPYFLVKFIVNLFKRKQKRLLLELNTPHVAFLSGIPDDRKKPPLKNGSLAKAEYDILWGHWRQSQIALKTMDQNMKESLPLLENAEKDYPNSYFIQYAKSVALFYSGKKIESYNILKELPNQRRLYEIKIDGAIASKKYQEALDLICKLPSKLLLETLMIFKYASCLIELNNFNAALEVLSEFNYRKPSNRGKLSSLWHYLRGQCYKELGDKSDAIKEYQKSQAYPLPDVDVQKEIDELRA